MQQQIEQDIKAALLGGDKIKAEALRNIKSAILNEAINKNLPRDVITDEVVQTVLIREAKKRQEAADLYQTAGQAERAKKELDEKDIINSYLPKEFTTGISEAVIMDTALAVINTLEDPSPKDMGKVIAAVREKLGPAVDGASVAKITRQALEKN